MLENAQTHNQTTPEDEANLDAIATDATNAINQLPTATQTQLTGTKELLRQLQRIIEAEDNLSPQDKAQALEQVKILAEAGKNPQAPQKQEQAQTAIRILRGMIAELPNAHDFLEESTRILPQLAEIFGIK
ncbi:MAG: hypothetical protein RID53_13585 [Coleofasciculus sp. B1-GNL1-01]|uniref:hypothetical protein n=1 Tax=Coleofasciculus sp. B1-GNL1-01 TaxID=3068484 RepID=UPI00330043CB